MRGGILKLLHLLSNQSNPKIPSRIANRPTTTLLRHLSSLPRRPATGGRRRDTRDDDDDSEEFFLRSLNFGQDNPDRRPHSDPITTSRPLRGKPRRALDHGEDLFSENRNRKGTIDRADPFVGIPDRPMRGDRRERRPLEENFDLGSFGAPREEEGAKRHDLGDQGITFDKEEWEQEITFDKREGDAQSGPSLAQKLKFTDSKEEEGKEEEKRVIGDSRERSSKEEHSVPEDADAIFSRLKKTGLIPNAVAMLDGLCKDGLIQEAMKLFGLMREKGTIPEVVIYTAVVEGFCKVGKCEDAKRIFRKMQKNGIVPNAFSYGVLIQGLCKGKRWDDCVEFALEMVASGHSPNVVTFTGLVDGIGKDKGLEEAEKVIRRLREGGLAVDEKAVRDHLDKKGPFSPVVWEAIFGKKGFKNIF